MGFSAPREIPRGHILITIPTKTFSCADLFGALRDGVSLAARTDVAVWFSEGCEPSQRKPIVLTILAPSGMRCPWRRVFLWTSVPLGRFPASTYAPVWFSEGRERPNENLPVDNNCALRVKIPGGTYICGLWCPWECIPADTYCHVLVSRGMRDIPTKTLFKDFGRPRGQDSRGRPLPVSGA